MRASSLPRHARTGQLAVGWRRPRPGEDPSRLYPIWPICGGNGRGEGGRDGGSEGDDDGDDQDDDDTSDKDKGDDGVDWKAEAEKWKVQARKHEARAKENRDAARERDRLKREGLPEQERAIEEAVAKALAEERSKSGGKLARQAFLAAAKGVISNAGEVADDVNLSRYVNDDGEVDEDGLADLVKRLAPKSDRDDDQDNDRDDERDTRRGGRDRRGFDQGARGGRSKDKRQSSVAAGRDLWAEKHGNKSKN